jgi:hypothetical protein
MLAAAGLLLAVLGLLNWAVWQRSLLGLTGKQMAICAFIPLFLIVYFVVDRPDPRSAE